MIPIFMIFAIGTILSLPAFMGDFFVAHDLLFHLNWNRAFTDQFWNGDLYPRWLASMNGGRGSPVFFFYGPFPFFVSALFKPFLTNDPHGWLQLGLSVSTALVLSGVFAFLWLRKVVDRRSAFIAAVVYMILPYHLLVDLYHRLSLAEFWSFVWMPLVLYATREIVDNKTNGILKFSIAYALLVMTHLPSLLIFSLIPPAYAIVLSAKGHRIQNLFKVLSSVGIGLGLSSIYLIPVLSGQENVSLSLIQVAGWKYENNFLRYLPSFNSEKEFSTFIFEITLLTVFIGVLCFLKNFTELAEKKENTFWIVVILLSLYLMFPVSEFVWENLIILQNIQFPWRFNILISLAVTALVAGMLHTDYKARHTFLTAGHLAVSGLIVVLFSLGMITSLKKSNENMNETFRNVVENSLQYSLGAPEYLPKWVPEYEKEKFIAGNIDRADMISNEVNSDRNDRLIQNGPRVLEMDVSGVAAAELTVGQFYYPGWTATLKEESKNLPVGVSGEGLLTISVPSGRHKVLVKLESTIEERLGQIVSLIFVVSCTLLYMPKRLVKSRAAAITVVSFAAPKKER